MLEHVAETSPHLKAMMAGVFQGLEGLTFTFGQVIVLGKLVVFHDAAATAANILGHQPLFRLGFASCVMGVGFHTVWGFLFYELTDASLCLQPSLFLWHAPSRRLPPCCTSHLYQS